MRGARRRQQQEVPDIFSRPARAFDYPALNREQLRNAHDYSWAFTTCKYCSAYHRNEQDKCYVMCHYCHSIHFKKDLTEQTARVANYVCPLVRIKAVQQQSKKAYNCDGCGSRGSYDKIIETTCYQLKQIYQLRIKQFERLRDQQGQIDLQKPQRKVYRTESQTKRELCQNCKGKGRIFRMVDCCENGCSDCGYSRLRVSSKWKDIRLRGEDNDQIFPCRICGDQVGIGQKIFKLHCGHTFHRNCIFSWIYYNEGCYLCSLPDPYIQKKDIPRQAIDRPKESKFTSLKQDPQQRKNIRKDVTGSKDYITCNDQIWLKQLHERLQFISMEQGKNTHSQSFRLDAQKQYDFDPLQILQLRDQMDYNQQISSSVDISESFVVGGPPLPERGGDLELDLSIIQKNRGDGAEGAEDAEESKEEQSFTASFQKIKQASREMDSGSQYSQSDVDQETIEKIQKDES